MWDEIIARHCAPTLAGIKIGSIFTYAYTDEDDMNAELERLRRLFSGRGVGVAGLRRRNGRVLIYVYRVKKLRERLLQADTAAFLSHWGYDSSDEERSIIHLASRLDGERDFPHEIGVFLGYPLEDIRGFIEHGGANCKLCGLWKVYGDEKAAKRYFERCRRCTGFFCRKVAAGVDVTRLIAAV